MTKFISILLIFVGLLVSNVSKSQSLIFDNNNYNRWVQAESGPGAFFVNTTTDYLLKNGYYYFNIYFYSNAANQQGYLTSCYVENITVYLGWYDNTNTLRWRQVVYLPYVLVQPKSNYNDGMTLAAYVYSGNMYQKIRVTWLSSSPY